MPPAIRSAFSSSVVAPPSSSPYHPPPSALPTTGQYASRYDPYAEREQRERDAEAAREREKKAEESRRKMQFFRMRDQMRSSQFDFTPSRNAKPKSPSYCSLSEISQQHPKRAILQRFDRLANIKGFDNANFYWRKRGEHVSCRTVIPPVMYSDIYRQWRRPRKMVFRTCVGVRIRLLGYIRHLVCSLWEVVGSWSLVDAMLVVQEAVPVGMGNRATSSHSTG